MNPEMNNVISRIYGFCKQLSSFDYDVSVPFSLGTIQAVCELFPEQKYSAADVYALLSFLCDLHLIRPEYKLDKQG